MTNRRDILQAAAVLPAVVGATRIAAHAHTDTAPLLPLHTVLIDERHAESRRLGARLAARGIAVHPVPSGDVTEVWLSHIDPLWRREPLAVAGLTERPVLFCLEQLAIGCGLRVVLHLEHDLHADGGTDHALLRGAEAAGLSGRDLTRAGPHWPSRIADALTRHPQRTGRRYGRSEAALEPSLPAGTRLLTSWIIAPV
jgi:hypothetical protein